MKVVEESDKWVFLLSPGNKAETDKEPSDSRADLEYSMPVMSAGMSQGDWPLNHICCVVSYVKSGGIEENQTRR